MIVLICVFAFNGIQLVQKYFDYSNSEQEYTSLKQYAPVVSDVPTGTNSPKATSNPNQSFNPEILTHINTDFAGWITIPGTNIDYPIVQGNDNTYYLTHSFKKERNSAGSIFLDYRINGDFEGKNSIIFGHHMRNDTMFAQINLFKSSYFSKLHPYAYIVTPKGRLKYEYIGSYIFPGNKDVLKISFNDGADFLKYIKQIQSISSYKTTLKIGKEDKLLTLVTCTYEFENARFVVHFKQVPS